MSCIDRNVMMCAGAMTEVEALKKALAEAEGKAIKEQAAHKKLKARLNEVQQELRDAVKKCETLEGDISARDTELAKARQIAEEARVEAQGALKEIQEAKKIAAGKAFSMQSKYVKKKYVRRCGVLPSRRRELNGEAVLVAIPCARTSGALHRSAKTAGRAA